MTEETKNNNAQIETIADQLLAQGRLTRLEIAHSQRPPEAYTLLLGKSAILTKLRKTLPVTGKFLYTLKKTGSANMVTSEYTINAILRPATKEEAIAYFNQDQQKAAGAE